MCGIVAIFGYDDTAPPVDDDELVAIRDAMANRGPDGKGLWISEDKRVGLAHRRLAVIDPTEAGAQPMSTADGSLWITYNGEIYNFLELRAELENKGYRFSSRCDTEVLLYLYQDFGSDMVDRLRGPFAFAIWDAQRQGLLLGRDHFGQKPLYYADNGRTLRVASSVKALLRGGNIDTRPDPAGHAGFFQWGYVPDPFTLYAGVEALPAGTTLWIDRDGQRQSHCYFDISGELTRIIHGAA